MAHVPGASRRPPSYRLHKASGQGLVTINGVDFYLGKHGTEVSRQKYDAAIAQWLARGRQIVSPATGGATITELLAGYLEHCKSYYNTKGMSRSQLSRTLAKHVVACRQLRHLFADLPCNEFGTAQFIALREHLVKSNCWGARPVRSRVVQTLSRNYINSIAKTVIAMFRWGAERALCSQTIWPTLKAVKPLQRGRTDARENSRVTPVERKTVEATLPFLSSPLQAVVKLQLLTGARGGEICQMRMSDIDMKGDVWLYRPEHHKTQNKGFDRVIPLGPEAQQIIEPFIRPQIGTAAGYLFRPADGFAELQARRKEAAVWKKPDSFYEKWTRRANPRPFRAFYHADSYQQAVRLAVKHADKKAHADHPDIPANEQIVPFWHPHQLRHTFAVEVVSEHGREAGRTLLGHQSFTSTARYAAPDVTKFLHIVRKIG